MSEDSPELARLLQRLALRDEGSDSFRASAGTGRARLFGGLVAAQAVIAAGRTVADARLHSLHAYFLRRGRSDRETVFKVERTRDGRRFAARRVTAEQDGRVIFQLAASFTRQREGIEHGERAPEQPRPEGLVDWEQARAKFGSDLRPRRDFEAFELRVVDPEKDAPGVRSAPERACWFRLRGTPPVDPLLRAALVVYASDRTLVRTAARAHGTRWHERPPASLDHALWLHREPDFDGWLLYDCHSPVARAGRGLAFGALYQPNGERLASVAQEGLIDTGDGAVDA
jgi:acyl-CoA thioesterase-2